MMSPHMHQPTTFVCDNKQSTALHNLWAVLDGGPFWSWAVFDLVVGRFGLAMGRFGHTENLWAVLVHGPFWSFPG